MKITLRELRSVYWTLSPIYYVVRVFGLSPYSMAVKNNRGRWTVNRSSLFYNVFFLVVVLLCLLPLIEHIKNTVHLGQQDKLAMYSEFFRRVSGILIAIFCVTLSLLNRHRTCELMENMDGFDMDLTSYGIKVDYEQMRRKNRTMIMAVYSLLLVSLVMDSIVRNHLIGEKSTQYWLASLLLFMVNYSTVVQFTGLVLALQKRFAILNKYFRTLNDKTTSAKKLKILFTSQEGKPQKEVTWRNLNTQVPIMKFSSHLTCVHASQTTKCRTNPVSIVCDFHDRLCEWGKSLNSLYSIQILCITGMVSVVVVIHLYTFYLMLSKNEMYKLTFYDSWKPAVWGLWFSSMIILTSYVCARTRDEANNTSVLLHQINFDLHDEEFRTNIEIFSLQMQHQKLEFSAGGFFLVDLCSLRTIMTTIITYLVFFIQFEMAARNGGTVKTSP